jgi:beta-galactosidase
VSTVEEQYFPYPAPQENGNKTDVRWLVLSDDEGDGLMFKGLPFFEFSALNYLPEDLSRMNDGIAHMSDPVKQDFVIVKLNQKQMGVGGDNSWGAKTHAKYCIPAKSMQFTYFIKPLTSGQDYWDKSRKFIVFRSTLNNKRRTYLRYLVIFACLCRFLS